MMGERLKNALTVLVKSIGCRELHERHTAGLVTSVRRTAKRKEEGAKNEMFLIFRGKNEKISKGAQY